jgi:hypothetical protein
LYNVLINKFINQNTMKTQELNICRRCGHTELKKVESVYIDTKNINTPEEEIVYGDALECLSCGCVNPINDDSYIVSYKVNTFGCSEVRRQEKEKSYWVKPSEVGDVRCSR